MTYCQHCNQSSFGGKYCMHCGEQFPEKPKESGSALWIIPVTFFIMLIFLVIILLPTKTISYTEDVPYTTTETYTEEVPYEAVEEYTVQVPYEIQEPEIQSIPIQQETPYTGQDCHQEDVNFNMKGECHIGWFLFDGDYTVQVTNLDNQAGGDFKLRLGYISDTGDFVSVDQTKVIQPLATESFTYDAVPASAKECRKIMLSVPITQVCYFVNKTRIDTVFKDVPKIKSVIKNRDETRYKTVTKTRTETREREVVRTHQIEKKKEVNWLFGFDAIIKFRDLG